jgi:choline dehydrogenase-like flavoprotein
VQAFGLFDEDTENYNGISAGDLICREGYVSPSRPGAFAGYQWQLGQAMKPNDIFGTALARPGLRGPALHGYLHGAARRLGVMLAFGGGVAAPENRIEPATERDAHGMRLVRTVHAFTPDMQALAEHLHGEGKAVFRAAGAVETWTGATGTGHLAGGTLMGDDPAASVTDSHGRTHDIDNLLLAGAGLFPCSGGASPTFTIHALAMRSADHMVEHWADFAG